MMTRRQMTQMKKIESPETLLEMAENEENLQDALWFAKRARHLDPNNLDAERIIAGLSAEDDAKLLRRYEALIARGDLWMEEHGYMAQKHFGVKDLQIIRNRNGIPKAQWQMGDYCCQIINGNVFQHVFVYLGGGEIVDASSQHADKRKDIAVRSYSGYSAKVIVRYTGGFTYIQKYDEGTAVLKWQDFLNWWSGGQFYKECGAGDGIFGENTYKWSVKFQEEVMGKGQGDGTVGPKTIAAAQSVRK